MMLGWRPRTSFAALVRDMVKTDIETVAAEPVRYEMAD
jgi:GDP-D-mannose dehydratase